MELLYNNKKVSVLVVVGCTFENGLYQNGNKVVERSEMYFATKNSRVRCTSYHYRNSDSKIFYVNEYNEDCDNLYYVARTEYKVDNKADLYAKIKKSEMTISERF